MPALGDKDVRRLDVAVDDPFGVRRIERVGDFDRHRQRAFDFEWPAVDEMLECSPVEILHRDEGLAFMLSDLVNGADVGMIQCGSGTCFAPEAFQRLFVMSYVLGQEFQGHETAQLSVLRPEDDSHAAATKLV